MDTLHALVHPALASARRPWPRCPAAAVLALGCLAGAAAHAQEDPPGRVGRVADISGDVRTLDAEGRWMDVVRNQVLSTGDRIATDKTGRATLQIGSTVVRLGVDSDLVVTQMDDQHVRLRFDHGQLAVRVRSEDIPGELFIDTDEGAWVPHHAGQYRFDRVPGQPLGAQAWRGDMLLEAPDSSLPLKAPQRVRVWRDARNTTHYHVDPPVKDAFGDGVLAQDRQDDAHAAAGAAAQVAPEMTGEADLARFGTWSAGPGGEHVWMPTKLPAGWQPYQQGAWTWKLPWGWTWVDDQPWGFAPFHYGRWLRVKGRWAWTPGRWGSARPVFAPALVGWIGGPALSVDGGPAIGWVALAPDEAVFPGYAVSARYWNAITEPSVSPASRRPVAINGRARLVPAGAATYANGRLPDAVTVVAANALAPWVPVSQMPGPRGAERRQPAFEKSLAAAAPTAPPGPPPGRGALSASSPTLQVPLAAAR
ncbi:MAG: hypothetical protein JF586_08695 [Burkholderiales bacterium]|nr:hypothetical protein [Burkholderiales bacterium]